MERLQKTKHLKLLRSKKRFLLILFSLTFISATAYISLVKISIAHERDLWSLETKILLEPVENERWNEFQSLLVCVTSGPRYVDKREAIRRTWGSHPRLRVVFFLGYDKTIDLNEEATRYNDIVQYDFHDSYRNLTLKTISLVRWASKNGWSTRTHVLKIDDDLYLNTVNLFGNIGRFNEAAIYGKIFEGTRPVRNNQSKWYLDDEEYPSEVFPRYAAGYLYIIQEEVLEKLNNCIFQAPHIPIEDVYLTGEIAEVAKVPRKIFGNQLDIQFYPRYDRKKLNTNLRLLMGIHKTSAKEQYLFWTSQLNDTGLL